MEYNCPLIKVDWLDACIALGVVGAALVVFLRRVRIIFSCNIAVLIYQPLRRITFFAILYLLKTLEMLKLDAFLFFSFLFISRPLVPVKLISCSLSEN